MKTVVFATILSALTMPLAAQWLKHPTPGALGGRDAGGGELRIQ